MKVELLKVYSARICAVDSTLDVCRGYLDLSMGQHFHFRRESVDPIAWLLEIFFFLSCEGFKEPGNCLCSHAIQKYLADDVLC